MNAPETAARPVLPQKYPEFHVDPALKEKGLMVRYAVFSVLNNPKGRGNPLKNT